MQKYIDISKSKTNVLTTLKSDVVRDMSVDSKGWTFSYVYHLIELKDIYLVLKTTSYKSPKDIVSNIKRLGLQYVSTPWEERRVLEQINALKNFGLIDLNGEILKTVFENSKIGEPLSVSDLDVFREIYFTYFRFKEIHSWFTEPQEQNRCEALKRVTPNALKENSLVLFPLANNSRFTNTFLLKSKVSFDSYIIGDGKEDLMRFWDVYVKWGQELNLLEKFSTKELDLKFSSHNNSLSCVYHKRRISNEFDLYNFLKTEYSSRYIQIPKLIFKIALKYRYSIEDIKKLIVEQSLKKGSRISLQRTSEIFIREKGKVFFPKYRDSYISHLMLQH